MTTSEFFTKWNGKSLDFDGFYGYQCMDLYQQYNKDVVVAPYVPSPFAKDVWNNYPKNFYTRIANTPNGVPQKGDVVIWGGGVNGGAGHIAVFYQGNVYSFTSFDQNWNGQYCHFQSHNYNYVLGWLRPKATGQPTPPQPISDSQFRQKTKDIILSGDIDSVKITKIKALGL